MGYYYTKGICWLCRNPFSFNPALVPSHPDEHGVKQPICQPCLKMVNQKRAELGRTQFEMLPGAYDPMTEGEMAAYMDDQDKDADG